MFALGVPTDDIVVKGIGKSAETAQPVSQIKLLGSEEQIKWDQKDDALTIHKPEKFASEDVVAFKIDFK